MADLRTTRLCLRKFFGPVPQKERGSIDEQLFGSILGIRTRDDVSLAVFLRLCAHYEGDWNRINAASYEELLPLLKGLTFPEKAFKTLKAAFAFSLAEYGVIGFGHLAHGPVEKAMRELEKISGVGRKTSAATVNFSTMRGRAFVVDTHVLRVLRRFGFIARNADTNRAFDAVMAAAKGMDADDLYELHWHIKYVGQQFCTHSPRRCEACPLAGQCLACRTRRLIVSQQQAQAAWS